MAEKIKRFFALLLSLTVLTVSVPVTSFAAAKTISTVKLKINSYIEVGTYVDDLELNIGSEGGDINVYSTGSGYEIDELEMVTSPSKKITAGMTIKIKAYLTPEDSSRKFSGTYSSGNVKITGGEYASSKKSNGDLVVTINISGGDGEYEAPEDIYWKYPDSSEKSKIGRVAWEEPDYTSGYYEIVLYRGGSSVKKVTNYKGSSYNFYPYMTSAGTYRVKIRTVPYTSEQKKHSSKSEWAESDEFYLDKNHVSDGSGGTEDITGTSAGWKKSGDYWYYRYPDGSYKKNGWAQVQGKWYLFDSNGRMLTGLNTHAGNSYLLGTDGAMLTGWQKVDGKWYYFNSSAGSSTEGAMIKNAWVTDKTGKYFLLADGRMATGWIQIAGKWYYFYPGQGNLAVNTVIETFRVDSTGAWVH